MILELVSPGALCTVQDAGRVGQRHLGIPPAGALDSSAMQLANRLLDNRPDAAVLECLHGTRLKALAPVQVALAGLDHARAWRAEPGEVIEVDGAHHGVWHYLALPGGVSAPTWLGSASICVRAGIGAPFSRGDRVACWHATLSAWPTGIRGRFPEGPLPSQSSVIDDAPIRIWPGPQWTHFSASARQQFVLQPWQVSRQSDRSGYRLAGEPLPVPKKQLLSEPVRVGSIQVPPDGQPIVCLNDGPTVGGYPKIGFVDPADLRRVVQTRAGGTLRFILSP